jgi:hypothetical protein
MITSNHNYQFPGTQCFGHILILPETMINDTDFGLVTLPNNAPLKHVCEVLKRDGGVSQS